MNFLTSNLITFSSYQRTFYLSVFCLCKELDFTRNFKRLKSQKQNILILKLADWLLLVPEAKPVYETGEMYESSVYISLYGQNEQRIHLCWQKLYFYNASCNNKEFHWLINIILWRAKYKIILAQSVNELILWSSNLRASGVVE